MVNSCRHVRLQVSNSVWPFFVAVFFVFVSFCFASSNLTQYDFFFKFRVWNE